MCQAVDIGARRPQRATTKRITSNSRYKQAQVPETKSIHKAPHLKTQTTACGYANCSVANPLRVKTNADRKARIEFNMIKWVENCSMQPRRDSADRVAMEGFQWRRTRPARSLDPSEFGPI